MPDPFEAAYGRFLMTDLAAGLRARSSRGALDDGPADRNPSQPPPSRLLRRLTLMSPRVRPRRRRAQPD